MIIFLLIYFYLPWVYFIRSIMYILKKIYWWLSVTGFFVVVIIIRVIMINYNAIDTFHKS